MARRSPRPLTQPRPDDPDALPAIDDPATDALDATGAPVVEPIDPDPADDSAMLGAYALGALTPEERSAVEDRLAASPALQDELRRLIPVAALLREATDRPRSIAVDPESHQAQEPLQENGADGEHDPAADRVPAPERDSPELGADGGVPAVDEPSDDQFAVDEPVVDDTLSAGRVEAAPGSLSSRPAGRRARPATAPSPARPRRAWASTGVGSWPLSWIAASLATLVAVGAVLWTLALIDRLDTRQAEVDGLEAELSELRARGDAAVVALAPVEGGPAEADGVVVVVPSEGSLIVRVNGLPASTDGRVYQVWFQDAAEGPDGRWIVGPVFRIGAGGATLVELPAATPDFGRLVISDEPSPGSEAPTGPFLLEGTLAQTEGE